MKDRQPPKNMGLLVIRKTARPRRSRLMLRGRRDARASVSCSSIFMGVPSRGGWLWLEICGGRRGAPKGVVVVISSWPLPRGLAGQRPLETPQSLRPNAVGKECPDTWERCSCKVSCHDSYGCRPSARRGPLSKSADPQAAGICRWVRCPFLLPAVGSDCSLNPCSVPSRWAFFEPIDATDA